MPEPFRESDRQRHSPAKNEPSNWQESFFLGWVDLASRSAGSHHVSFSPATCTAHAWSWLVVDGKRVAREAAHALPLGDLDLTEFECGGRLGQGFFEPAELKGPTPAMRKELGLEA